jgi:glutamate dehydrogenase/leucine dehydrogenase
VGAIEADATAGALAAAFEHEHLELFHDPASGLIGAVAIHSTALGPALGGLRLHPYRDVEALALDALRLAGAMTLKNATAGLSFGGGKAVLLDDGRWDDRMARLLAFADVLNRLGGRYVTAEDVGTTPADMDLIATRTRWVTGLSPRNGGHGDPSPATAHTVHVAIEAAVHAHLGRSSLRDVEVGVLGAGKVGAALAALLVGDGARVTIADVDHQRAVACAGSSELMRATSVAGFLRRRVDVLAPCAMGAVIGSADVPELRCRIVAGAANNPLVDRDVAIALHRAGILYVPDFIANCGGVIQVAAELQSREGAALGTAATPHAAAVGAILAEAVQRDELPLDVAVEHAERRIAAARAGQLNQRQSRLPV